MRLTIRTNLAARILMYCALNDGRLSPSGDIARRCNASPHHVLHVVARLAEAGLIETMRGRTGGIRLARSADQISIGRVFRSLEAGVPFTECFDPAGPGCPLAPACRLRGAMERALEAFYAELDEVTLTDLVCDNAALAGILALEAVPLSCAGATRPGSPATPA